MGIKIVNENTKFVKSIDRISWHSKEIEKLFENCDKEIKDKLEDHLFNIERISSKSMKDKERINNLETALHLLLDNIDYTAGACKPNEMIGAILPVNLLKKIKEVLNTKGEG